MAVGAYDEDALDRYADRGYGATRDSATHLLPVLLSKVAVG
jgi:hypothetical protein